MKTIKWLILGLSVLLPFITNGHTKEKSMDEIVVIDGQQPTERRLPCNKGDMLVSPATKSAEKFCDLRIYQIMVESFVDGDPTLGYGVGYGHSHHRGDLQGIINSLDYIKSLNVNAIWLTPIFDSASAGDTGSQLKLDATGYYAYDYFKVDPNFGTFEQVKELVEKAHQRGLYVFFDGVFGHVKKNGVVPSPSGLTPTLIPCPDAPHNPGLCAKYPESRHFFAEVATYWMKAVGIDGWRLDQAYQVPVADWAFLQNKVQVQAKKSQTIGYMVAEIWSDLWTDTPQRIQKWGFGTNQRPGLMSVFDFPVRYALVKVLATQEKNTEKNAHRQPASLLNGPDGLGSHAIYPNFAIPNLMIGNHDTVRFGNLLQRARIAYPNEPGYWRRHRLAFDFLTAYSGPITLYYGDEIGDFIPNFSDRVLNDCLSKDLCDDHVSRTDAKIIGVNIQANELNPAALQLKNEVAQLMQLKANHPALHSGSRTHLGSGVDYYVDLKVHGKERIVFIMNTSTNAKVFQLKSAALANNVGDMWPASAENLMTKQRHVKKNNHFEIQVSGLSAKFLLLQ